MNRLPSLSIALIALTCSVFVLASSCKEDEVAASDFVKSEAPRTPADAAAAGGAAKAVGLFGTDLYGILTRDTGGNVVFSPYSAAVALAMTRAGANGETLAQMDAVLHAAEAGDLDAGMNAIDQWLATLPGEYDWVDKKVTLDLSTANRLFGQKGFEFAAPFLDQLAKYYGAGLGLVDYVEDTEGARKTINDWVAEQTRDRIPELIVPGILTTDTRLVLTNAIYLNAPWLHRFNADSTAPAPFTRLDGTTVDAQMMRLSENLRYAKGAGYEAVELPYVDGSLGMLVIVPDAGGFAEVEGSLDGTLLADVDGALQAAAVDLQFPKFEFRTQAGLKDALIELGMPIAFSGEANFSKMTPNGASLAIQDVIHEAFIAVDEEGTEAAAATAVIVGETSAPVETVQLTVDRPFVFAIRDNETGAVLFMGRVTDPTAK